MKRLLAAITLGLILGLISVPIASASCPKTSLIDIQDEVMCEICGVPLVNAGGPQSEDVRDFIRERADRCESKAQIKLALVDEFGPGVLAMPQKSGFDLTAYIVPIVVLLAALGAIVVGAIGWRRTRGGEELAVNSASEDDQLDSDLQRYDL